MLTEAIKEMNEKKAKEFEMRFNMLALTLSLKNNDMHFEIGEFYQLLFSTYIKMIESDQNDFFIEKKRKAKIIQSLERTKAFYDFEHKKQLQAVFEKMTNDDPTDFMLFPIVFLNRINNGKNHLCGFTVYKKNEEFLVMKVDKQEDFDDQTISYYKIPATCIEELSQLFFNERDFLKLTPYSIFNGLIDISSIKVISTRTMKEQDIGKCVISEVEDSLRTILFNCQTDIFSLPKDTKIMPKWNLKHSEPTVEMRKRFVSALKGENKDWNQHFDYIFDYYLYRKGELIKNSYLETHVSSVVKDLQVQKIFSMDAYIPEMLKNNGRILEANEQLGQLKIGEIDPPDILHTRKISENEFLSLRRAQVLNTKKIEMFYERLPLIKIQRAKEITQYIISRLKDKNQEIETELQRRKEIEMKAKRFEKRVDMLALTLSLKENDRFFENNGGYKLLFSTYIKMIENDQDNFFIEKERKERIIYSLERTKAFYDFKHKEQLQAVLEKMTNDDPTDFVLFPSGFSTSLDKMECHMCGLTVYKKNEDFIVMKVDKERSFDRKNVTFFKIPSTNVEELSQIFFERRNFTQLPPDCLFKRLGQLSRESKAVPSIIIQYQKSGTCVISEIEASLRMILFNCRTDIFNLAEGDCMTPKWNSVHSEPTIEMRKRFVAAMKGEDEAWDQHFDYLFDYYLCRKGKLVGDSSLTICARDMMRYWKIRETFSMDKYIPEMLKNSGQLPTDDVPLKEEKIKGIDPSDIYMKPIEEINIFSLKNIMQGNTYKIKLFNERLPFIKIQRAKDITESIISRLQDKNKKIEAEIQRREEIEMARQDKRDSKQSLYQSISNVVSRTHQPIRTRSNRSAKKVRIDDRLEQLKKRQEPKNTRIREERMKVREIRMDDRLDQLKELAMKFNISDTNREYKKQSIYYEK
ncbi:hypothetical protein E1H99_00380 [Enterococcus hirae]|nr:hypothetical protein E1H99_00380 [Enterococcus hirae]